MLRVMLSLFADLGTQAANTLTEKLGPHAALPTQLPVQFAGRPEFGDLQIASCLQLAKPLGQNPRQLATWLVESLSTHPAIEKAEIAGPGYVNLHLKSSWLAQQVQALHNDASRGLHSRSLEQTAVVDFSSPNIAKPMHVGHIRSTILGDACQRILKAVGYRVISDNHLGDWGTQFGKLIVAYNLWLDLEAYQRAPVTELVRLYQKFVEEEKDQAQALGLAQSNAEEDTEEPITKSVSPLLQAARTELRKLQQGDATNLALWKEFVAVSMQDLAANYQRLDVRFDVQLGESFYNPFLAPLVQRLLDQGIAQVSENAVVCPVESEPIPLLIRKADGAFLYGTTDLATVEYRTTHWNPSRILYVVGEPQQLHFRQVFAVARKMGVSSSLEHISFGSIRFQDKETGKWTMGSTRKGNVPLLDQLLDEAIQRAIGVVREKNPDLSEEECHQIAQAVGIGAVKYNNLNRDRNADIHFDLDQALSLEGNTAPYIQYAYARLRSILRKAPMSFESKIILELPAERALAKKLLQYPYILQQTAQSIKLHLLTEYLYELGAALNQFYHEVPVLKAEPTEKASRLQLLEETAQTLQHGLSLLGIECPERM